MQTKDMFDRAAQRQLPIVLLIDDDLVSREVAATLLTMTGFTVHTTESGEAAIDALDKGTVLPGAIVMDAQMPGLSGTGLIAQLRTRTAAGIYVISGSNPPAEVVSAADGFLIKPFDAGALHKLLIGQRPAHAASLLNPNQPVISTETLAQLRKMMPESAVRDIFKAVFADLTGRVDTLAAAISRGDFAEVRRIGHAIKGGCGMAGALQAANLGAQLESLTFNPEDNQLDNSTILLADLRIAARDLGRMLDAELPV